MLGTEPGVLITASRQQHGVNAPHDTPEEYYRRDLFIPAIPRPYHIRNVFKVIYINYQTLDCLIT